jgi:hypothetical protein
MSTNEWQEEIEDDDFFSSDNASVTVLDAPANQDLEIFAPAESVAMEVAPDLSVEEAQSLTEHIRATADVLYVLIQRAHAGRAWKVLGYDSFADYVNAEFNISRSRAYQLLNQAKVVEEITAAAPEGTRFDISEAAARDLKSLVSELSPDIKEATEGLSADDAGAVVEDLIREYRDKKNEAKESGESYDEELAADQADRDGFSSNGNGPWSGEGGNRNGDVESSSVEDSDDDDDIEKLLQFDEDPRETRIRFESVYNLYSTLSALKDMPSFGKMIGWIPEERRVQITASLPEALSWLQAFSDKWNEQEWASTEEEFNSETTDREVEEQADEDFFTSDEDEDLFKDLN